MNKKYDIIILGGGIAAMTAAIYASKANLNAVILEKSVCGGLVNTTHLVENFPSQPGINGMDLMDNVGVLSIKIGLIFIGLTRSR